MYWWEKVHHVNSITADFWTKDILFHRKKKNFYIPHTPKKQNAATLIYNIYSLLTVAKNYLWLQLTIKWKSTSFTLAKWESTIIFVITIRLVNYYNGVDLWHIWPIRWSECFTPQWVLSILELIPKLKVTITIQWHWPPEIYLNRPFV